MIKENVFIPRILLCGSREEFFARVGQRSFEIIGQVEFLGAANGHELDLIHEGKFLLNDKPTEYAELHKMLMGGGIDFIIFNDDNKLNFLLGIFNRLGCPRSQVMTLREFNHLPSDGFYDMYADIRLLMLLRNLSIKTLLDVDAHFLKSQLFTKAPNDLTEIDCICQEKIPPIKENLFRHVYKDFSECVFHHYDAVLINEKSPADFDNALSMLEHSANLVITFVRNGSALFTHIKNTVEKFDKVNVFPSFAGAWIFCYRRRPPEDFAMYVVTHKKLSTEHVSHFPEGYKVIHAGRTLGNDSGYLGDDTGENISHLNLYINELTAIYWIWKNTSQTVVGHCSYRRFFTTSEENPLTHINDFSYEKILTKDEALKLLTDCDIVVTRLALHPLPQFEDIKSGVGEELASFAMTIMKKNLLRNHPDYVDTFDYVMNSPSYYECHMFITRRNIFDDYCKWLFSFILDALDETFRKITLSKLHPYARRVVGFFSERMFTVWLMKNRLRIKEIKKMFVNKNIDG